MANKAILVTSDSCGACAHIKKTMAKEIKKGGIKVVSIETEKGAEIANRFNVNEVPTLLSCDKELRTCTRLA